MFVTSDGVVCKDTVLELLELLKGRTLTIVGDSISYQTFTALQYDINRHGIAPQHSMSTYLSVTDDSYQLAPDLACNHNHVTGLNECKAAHSQKFVCNCTSVLTTHVLAYNATVRYANVWEFEPPETYIHVHEHKFNPIKHALMEHLINTVDLIITNVGFHYTKKTTFAFSAVVEYLTETLTAYMLTHSYKRHFWWLSLPVRFPSPYTGLGVSYEQFNATHYKGHNHTACRRFTEHRHFTDRAAQGLIEGRLPMRDAFSIFWDRGNLHSRHKVMPWFPTDCFYIVATVLSCLLHCGSFLQIACPPHKCCCVWLLMAVKRTSV